MRTAQFTIVHDCPYSNPIRAVEGLRVTHLCHRGRNAYLEIHADTSEALEPLVAEYRERGGELVHTDPGDRAALVRFSGCDCCQRGQVIPRVERSEALYLPPSTYTPRGETYHFLLNEGPPVQTALEGLRTQVDSVEVTLHSLETLGFEGETMVSVGRLFGRLTERQRAALSLATAAGYYRIPRHVRTEDLARRMGISRPGFEKLLRRAEGLILLAILPYLSGAEPPPPADQP
ncbi:MAG: helix-turn-helix domain-containing protein [Thermoplasmata archaeon]